MSEIKLGVQSYSLRKFSLEKALESIADLGLKYAEVYPDHLPSELSEVTKAKQLEEKYGVKIAAYGIKHMSRDEEKLRKLFEFAHKIGIEVLTADPDLDTFDLLDRLVEEYGIAVAIHNHGPGHRYATAEDVLKAVENHSQLIGMCLDTGHLARAGQDPAEAARKLGKRLYGVHLKDINKEKKDVILGEGIIDFKKLFEVIKETNMYSKAVIVIEYELEPENPLPGIRKSLNYIRALI
ncbi:MAG: sugar phosphate isomerase/epimerase [Thermoprotei archaeon]|nr:MAG: sugar phosphate isomerase/epimerase [Thermoprotei archaeon]RLE98423.1 MAG: sugar phosphate isomerase/epimerase [Thermoprotei archaeon]